MRSDFVVLILSHGRPDRVWTIESLRRAGYTGRIVIVIDNEDERQQDYLRLYKNDVYVFDKLEESKHTDTMDQRLDRRIVVYARNKCHDIAKQLGYKYFLVLDDDYVNYRQRYEDDSGVLRTRYVRDFDALVDVTLDFLVESGATSIAWAQTGEFILGKNSAVWKDKIRRKAMNAFFCCVDKPFKFIGSINEDVNAYCVLGQRGELFFTVRDICVDQTQTQANAGGLTDAYKNLGTYIKSFYSVMCCPSFVKVSTMGVSEHRFHHNINWNNAVPKIISSKYRKE